MNPTPVKHSHSISSPFAVKDREKFLVWARERGIQVHAVRREPLDRVCISPPIDGEWHFMDVPEDVELSQENGFWAWFSTALGEHLPDNTVVTIFEAFADEFLCNISWVDAAVHVISSRGDYVYGDLCDLAQYLILNEPWPLGQVNLYSPGLQGAFDGFVTLPDPELQPQRP